MPVDSVAEVVVRRPSDSLRERLRSETAAWHETVEAAADIAHSVRTRGDYVDLLVRLHGLHGGLEDYLTSGSFYSGWHGIGIDIAAHRRAHLLAADLEELGGWGGARRISLAPSASFSRAVGCLYVVEGSTLGGRVVARMVRAAIGEVPTRFLTGRGRPHAASWPAVCTALNRFDQQQGDGDGVVAGACETFAVFADHLSGAVRS